MPASEEEEFLEVVDEQDRVTGTASRREIHRKSLRHRSVHIFIFNSAGQIYLQKRSPNKDQYPGHWDSSAAGHVDPGETPREAARRELAEELGLEAELIEVLRYPAALETGWEFVTLYEAQTDAAPVLNLEEATCGDYFDPPSLDRLLRDPLQKVAPGFRRLHVLYLDRTAK